MVDLHQCPVICEAECNNLLKFALLDKVDNKLDYLIFKERIQDLNQMDKFNRDRFTLR